MEERSRIEERWSEYLKALYQEKQNLESTPHTLAFKLVEQEIQRVQSDVRAAGKPESKYADVIREKPIRVTTRIVVPVRDHPKFNFVGKLLGPKGNSLKRLQEETLTRMAILGRGSMRDKVKEEEMRKSNHPRAAHLHEELHVEIVAFAPPAEAYARMAYALTQVRRYLIPDNNDQIRQEQMQEMKRLGLKDDNRTVDLRQPPGAEQREPAVLEAEETASGSSPGQDSCLVPAEDDSKCSEELEAGVLVPRALAPFAGTPPQRQRVLNILDRARLISESSRVAKIAKGVDSRSFTVESSYELPEAFIAPEGRSTIQWLGIGAPMERRRFRHAPYILPK